MFVRRVVFFGAFDIKVVPRCVQEGSAFFEPSTNLGVVQVDVGIVIGRMAGGEGKHQETVEPVVEAVGLGEETPILGDNSAMTRETQALRKQQGFRHVEATVIYARDRELCVSSL